MRRWLALLCVVALLVATVAAGAAAGGAAVLGIVAAVGTPEPHLEALPGEADFDARERPAVAQLLFRGPPSPMRSPTVNGNRVGEDAWRGRDGWRRS